MSIRCSILTWLCELTKNDYQKDSIQGVQKQFTGYEHDVETGLDFAEARMYQNLHGRFTAVDPLLASGKSANPQTFNRYAYTMNRPLILTDVTGLQAGQKSLETRAREVRVPKSARTVTPSAPGIFVPSGGGDGILTEFKLSQAMISDLAKLKSTAYQLQFVITKDNLNEAVNGRVAPSSGNIKEVTNQDVARADERSAGLQVDSEGKLEANVGAKQGETNQAGRSNEQSESGPINSGDRSKPDAFDILTDETNNFAAKFEGTTLTGYTQDGKVVKPNMPYDFFVETAQREIALSREEAIRNAIKTAPER